MSPRLAPWALTFGVPTAAVGLMLLVAGCSGSHRSATARAARTTPQAASGGTSTARVGTTTSTAQPAAPVQRMVGQMVMAGMTGFEPDAGLLDRVRSGEVGGIILYSDNIESDDQARRVIHELQTAAREGGNPPLLISVDQEGGSVRRFSDGPPISPRSIDTPDEAFSQGVATGRFLRAEGVNVDLAPVADVSTSPASFEIQQGRGFNGDSEQVSWLASSFADGLQQEGVAACGKHFPGVGSLTSDTDFGLGHVNLSDSQLEDALSPFKSLISNQVDMVMVASAVYPSLDPDNPADFSPRVINGLLRDRLQFDGVVITDALDSPSDLPGGTPAGRAVIAASAGNDIILFAPEADAIPAYQAILAAAERNQIPRASIAAAYHRILALKRAVAA